MTGYSLSLTAERIEKAGVRQLILKPVTIRSLGRAVHAAISGKLPIIKWDGYRAMIGKHDDDVQLWSRNENSLAATFPSIVTAGATLKAGSCLIDGEIVALDPKGHPSFQALQNRATTDFPIVFYAFDLLSLDGKGLRARPLSERREALNRVLAGSEVRVSSVLTARAERVVTAISELGLEGVVRSGLIRLTARGTAHQTGKR